MDNYKLPPILTLKQACEILNCHPNTLRNWDNEGKLKAVRFGKRQDRRYKKEDVINFLNDSSPVVETNTVFFEEIQLPVFGLASCGEPKFLADENNIEDYVAVEKNLLKRPAENYYLVRTAGTSMDKAGIKDRSLVLIEKKDYYDKGEDVLAIIDGLATIKRFFGGKFAALFMPVSNDEQHEPIVANNYHIAGKVVGIIPDPSAFDELRYVPISG